MSDLGYKYPKQRKLRRSKSQEYKKDNPCKKTKSFPSSVLKSTKSFVMQPTINLYSDRRHGLHGNPRSLILVHMAAVNLSAIVSILLVAHKLFVLYLPREPNSVFTRILVGLLIFRLLMNGPRWYIYYRAQRLFEKARDEMTAEGVLLSLDRVARNPYMSEQGFQRGNILWFILIIGIMFLNPSDGSPFRSGLRAHVVLHLVADIALRLLLLQYSCWSTAQRNKVVLTREDLRVLVKNTRLKDLPENSTEAYECQICMDAIKHNERIAVLPCNHRYHTDCINPWLLEYSSLCPICGASVFASQSSVKEIEVF